MTDEEKLNLLAEAEHHYWYCLGVEMHDASPDSDAIDRVLGIIERCQRIRLYVEQVIVRKMIREEAEAGSSHFIGSMDIQSTAEAVMYEYIEIPEEPNEP